MQFLTHFKRLNHVMFTFFLMVVLHICSTTPLFSVMFNMLLLAMKVDSIELE